MTAFFSLAKPARRVPALYRVHERPEAVAKQPQVQIREQCLDILAEEERKAKRKLFRKAQKKRKK